MKLDNFTLWLDKHKWLKEFEEGLPISGIPEEKWRFYFQVQDALKSLPKYISKDSNISSSSEITGSVVIESGAQILPNTFIKGPSYIGKNALVGNSSLIRPGTFISKGAIVGNHCYCTAAVIGPQAGVFHFCGISRSVIERKCIVSVFVVTASTRADLKPILHALPKEIESTPVKRGSIIGENTFIGPHVVISPGVIIGNNCFIGPYINVAKNVNNGTRLDTIFKIRESKNNIAIAEFPKFSPFKLE